MNKTSSLLRDLLNESFDNIHIDDKKMYDEARAYIPQHFSRAGKDR